MKIAVIGATGLVGAAVVKELAQRGHQVIAFARNTAEVPASANVQPQPLDVTSPDFRLAGFDAVVSAFNAGWENPNYVADSERGYAAIFRALAAAQVPYSLIVGGAGSLYVAPQLQLVDTPDFPAAVYPGANFYRNLLNEIRDRRDFNWTFLSPAAMFAVNEPHFERSGQYRLGGDQVLMAKDGQPADISVPDLACAIADEIERPAHRFQRFTVAAQL